MYYSISLFIPEIVILTLACFVLLFNLFLKQQNWSFIYYIIQFFLIFILFFLFFFDITLYENNFFQFSFTIDKYTILLKIVTILCLFFVFVYTKFVVSTNNLKIGEYYSLSLFSTLGMLFLISSGNLLVFYLSIELISIPLYALIAMIDGYKTSPESAIKYFVLGSIASGILLFGISLIYGSTGFINFYGIQNSFSITNIFISNILVQCGYFLIICGLLFKLGAVPFHMWVPDVYKGSSVFITLFISSVPKIAVFGIFYKFIFFIFYPFYSNLISFLIICAVLSLFVGNIFALVQNNIKRMFAYSSISNTGFILLGLVCFEQSSTVIFFYLFVYIFTTLGAFSLLLIFTKSVAFELEDLDNFKGFGIKEPLIACVLLIFLLSMAGIPPLLGFYSKLLVLSSVLAEGFIFIAVFSVLLTVIGLFFYLRVVKLMFFDSPVFFLNENKLSFYNNKSGFLFLMFNGFLLLFFGVYPYPLLRFCSLFIL